MSFDTIWSPYEPFLGRNVRQMALSGVKGLKATQFIQ